MNRTRIRDRAARVAYRLAVRLGSEMDYIVPGAAAVPVWGFVNKATQETQLRGRGETDLFEIEFVIPRQTNFTPSSFVPGTTIRYPKTSGTLYQIDTIEHDNEEISQASTWSFKCGRFGQMEDY